MTSLIPCLWFDDNLEEAVSFYTSVLPDSSIGSMQRNAPGEDGRPGSVMTADWTMVGLPCRGINGGPMFHFTEAISMSIACQGQEEVDRLWDTLVEGGEESQCGWLKDKFGLSWQIVPQELMEHLSDPDPARANAALQAMFGMRKIVIADLQAAADSV